MRYSLLTPSCVSFPFSTPKKIGRTLLCLFACFIFTQHSSAQLGEWTWMKGSSSSNSTGTFGTMGVPNIANTPPALYSPFTWTDLNGNFWLYGGLRFDNGVNYAYSALWKFEPDSNRWTWINGFTTLNHNPHYGTIGVPSPTNQPGGRGFAGPTWVDADGNLWLYGGAGYFNSYSDLWKYDLSTGEWTCMGHYDLQPNYGVLGVASPSNSPGDITETTAAWTDASGDLWFFGGLGFSGTCAAVWKYEMTSGNWIWMHGDSVQGNIMGVPPIYGSQGIFNNTNSPGGRFAYCHWKDSTGKFWIYGGGHSTYKNYADLWAFDPVINQWAWMGGDTSNYYQGNFTSTCDTTSLPRCGSENRAVWVDQAGHVGKLSGTATGSYNPTNDLMVLDPVTMQWVWVSGSTTLNASGVYGTMGVPDPANVPAGRLGSVGWIDQGDNLWYFGGRDNMVQDYNTLWKFTLDPNCPQFIVSFPPLFTASDTDLCEQSCISFSDLSPNNPVAWEWIFPGGNPSSSTLQNPTSICYNLSGTYDVTLITTNASGNDTLMLPGYITVHALPATPVITQSNDTLTSSAGYSYQWFMSGNVIPAATSQQLVITQSGDYSVMITDSLGCSASDTIPALLLFPQSAFSSGATSGCPGSCFDFINASLNATTYQWFFPGGTPASSSQQNPSNICYATSGVYDVTLIASSNFSSDTLVQSGYITIFTPLVVSVSQNGNFLTCDPAANSYQWLLNGNQIPGATSQTLFITQTGMYTVEVTDPNGCTAADTLTVNSIPSPNFSVTDTLLCEKFCINFFDQSTNNPTAWQWIFPGGDPSSSTDQNPAFICYNVPGTYDVTLITTNANGNDTLLLQNYITVYPTPPFPTITQNGYTLTSSPAYSYQWQLNAVDIAGATNQSYDILQSGFYTVIVGDSNGCVNSISQYVLISGVAEVGDMAISIYPNPSSGGFTVEWINSFMTGDISIDVVNTLGQIIFTTQERLHSEKMEIDLGDVARGVYFVEIKTENDIIRKKIVIAR